MERAESASRRSPTGSLPFDPKRSFANNRYSEFYEATIGAGYFEKSVTVDSGNFNLCIWDTAGQERFASLASFYYRGTQIALVVFDISKRPTFERAKAWITELNGNAPANAIVSLVGNKSDLGQREVMTDVSHTGKGARTSRRR